MAWYRCTGSGGGGGGQTVTPLIDQNDLIAGKFIQPSNGTEGSTSGFSATPFIEVNPDEVLTMALPASGNSQNYNCFYDSSQAYISNFTWSNAGYFTITVPSTCHYIRMSSQTANMNKLQVWKGL